MNPRLTEFAARYFDARPVCPEYAANVRSRAAKLQAYAGCSAIERVLDERIVSDFLRSLVDLSPYTVRSYRADILSLWNSAADGDLVPYPRPRRIFLPDKPELRIECYLEAEANRLLETIKTLTGDYPNGVPRRLYWSAAVRLAWDTGVRRGDVLKFRRDWVRPDGSLVVVQSKTRKRVPVKLHRSTLAALDAIGLDQPCRWPLHKSHFARHFKRIRKAAGVGRGQFRWLRRSSGSYVEAKQVGAGWKHLGQSNPRVFDEFYDAQLGERELPMPPELES